MLILGVVAALWGGMCGFVLAVIALAWRFLGPPRRGVLLGLGVGACLMSSLSLVAWGWLGFRVPEPRWVLVVPMSALLTGAWAVVQGAKSWR